MVDGSVVPSVGYGFPSGGPGGTCTVGAQIPAGGPGGTSAARFDGV